mmetsp:Transcript_23714/g.52573  ORF Transcript_23714/g.52573 Transcript_23714/m.52573 type:complete len:213 (-) Transcript_23714:630-1268(-)
MRLEAHDRHIEHDNDKVPARAVFRELEKHLDLTVRPQMPVATVMQPDPACSHTRVHPIRDQPVKQLPRQRVLAAAEEGPNEHGKDLVRAMHQAGRFTQARPDPIEKLSRSGVQCGRSPCSVPDALRVELVQSPRRLRCHGMGDVAVAVGGRSASPDAVGELLRLEGRELTNGTRSELGEAGAIAEVHRSQCPECVRQVLRLQSLLTSTSLQN